MNEAFYRFLGLAAKAGAVVCGSDACEAGVKNGRIKLVLTDGSASENTKKGFRDACAHYGAEIMILEEEDMLGDCLGKPGKKVVGIRDAGFAREAKTRYVAGGEKT